MSPSNWGIPDTPFQSRSDPRFFYESPTHKEALARLHFLIEHRRRVGLLAGPHGSGKSLVLEVFADQMRQAGRPVAKVNLLGVEPPEFLWLLAAELGMNPDQRTPNWLLWRAVTDRIVEYRYQQLETAVLLDDVDRAEDRVLAQIARLARSDSSPESRLTILLSCRPDGLRRLGSALLESVELRIDLDPWEPAETESYLKTSLAKAGSNVPSFAAPAIARLHELAHGIPRRISQLADLAVLAAAGRDLEHVDAETVEAVYHELGVTGV